MDKREAEIKAKEYVKEARGRIAFDKAVLFGSFQSGQPEKGSDIDIGLFVDKLDESVDYLNLMAELYHVAAGIDARIESHLFIREEDDSGFAELIEKSGMVLTN